MPRMTDVDVDYISLVKKGANRQKIQIYKAEDFKPETSDNEQIKEVTGFFNAIKSFFIGGEVRKADNKLFEGFKERMTTHEVMDNIWRVNDILVSVMKDILNSDIEDKEEALNTAIDEHGAYLKAKMKGINSIKKTEKFFRKERGGNEKMKKEELIEIINESLNPIKERIDILEKKLNQEGDESIEKETEYITKEDIAKAIKEAIVPLNERIEKIENFKGISKQIDDVGPINKSTSIFAGIDI